MRLLEAIRNTFPFVRRSKVVTLLDELERAERRFKTCAAGNDALREQFVAEAKAREKADDEADRLRNEVAALKDRIKRGRENLKVVADALTAAGLQLEAIHQMHIFESYDKPTPVISSPFYVPPYAPIR